MAAHCFDIWNLVSQPDHRWQVCHLSLDLIGPFLVYRANAIEALRLVEDKHMEHVMFHCSFDSKKC